MVIIMFYRASKALADACIKREWIEIQDRDWCIYAIEKRIITIPFWIFIFLWLISTNLYVETFSFLIPFYALRRRMGGWHAPNCYVCFIMSVSIVILSVGVFGKIISTFSNLTIVFLSLVVINTAMLMKPVYPTQVHFSTAEIICNNKIKNRITFVILLLQFVFLLIGKIFPIIYSSLGITMVIISVQAEKIKQEREVFFPHIFQFLNEVNKYET